MKAKKFVLALFTMSIVLFSFVGCYSGNSEAPTKYASAPTYRDPLTPADKIKVPGTSDSGNKEDANKAVTVHVMLGGNELDKYSKQLSEIIKEVEKHSDRIYYTDKEMTKEWDKITYYADLYGSSL